MTISTSHQNLSDLQLLRALLSLPPGLPKQRGVFQAMYDKLVVGGQISLSPKQRQWVIAVFNEHKLKDLPIPSDVRTMDPGRPSFNLGPLPLKPPGR